MHEACCRLHLPALCDEPDDNDDDDDDKQNDDDGHSNYGLIERRLDC